MIRTIKQFPQNISVTILNGDVEFYDKPFDEDHLKKVCTLFEIDDALMQIKSCVLIQAWFQSRESLKRFHPNADYIHSNELNSKYLIENPDYLYNVCAKLINNWRKNVKSEKTVTLKTNKS